ncbi:MAG: delta-60 repeat domain-containing protein [Candidatus Peribacteria bacterium]|nr:MAG: delta-60 repeat domain-containing protein [Candidatus Peribacteria bacterium]
MIVGGRFTSYDGSSANNLIRLNPDGSRDTTFNIGG